MEVDSYALANEETVETEQMQLLKSGGFLLGDKDSDFEGSAHSPVPFLCDPSNNGRRAADNNKQR